MTPFAPAWALTWIAAVLLVLAGAAKLRRPDADALALAGLPSSPVLARALGAGEVVLGLAAVLTSHPLAAAGVAVAYGGFAVVSLRMLRAGRASCGCFGATTAPLTGLHVAVNAVLGLAAAVAAGAGLAGAGRPPLPDDTWTWVLLAASCVLGAVLVRMVLVLLPALADGLERLRVRA
jgi:hypothetical protein